MTPLNTMTFHQYKSYMKSQTSNIFHGQKTFIMH